MRNLAFLFFLSSIGHSTGILLLYSICLFFVSTFTLFSLVLLFPNFLALQFLYFRFYSQHMSVSSPHYHFLSLSTTSFSSVHASVLLSLSSSPSSHLFPQTSSSPHHHLLTFTFPPFSISHLINHLLFFVLHFLSASRIAPQLSQWPQAHFSVCLPSPFPLLPPASEARTYLCTTVTSVIQRWGNGTRGI